MQNECPSYEVKLGKTRYFVCVKQAETAKKPLEEAFRSLCIREVTGEPRCCEKIVPNQEKRS